MSWKVMYIYAFPPYMLLGRVVEKMVTDHPCKIILIATKWTNQFWYARILEQLVDFPLVSPQREDLLLQIKTIRDISYSKQCAYTLGGLPAIPLKQAFRRKLLTRFPELRDNPLELSLVGVMQNRSILSRSLFRD